MYEGELPTAEQRSFGFSNYYYYFKFTNVYKYMKKIIEGDSKRLTQFRTSMFPELYMTCE